MSYWAFQADAQRYRLLEASIEQDETTWSVNQYADQVDVGDTVVMWLSGARAGAYALGKVMTKPAKMLEDAALTKFWADPKEAGNEQLRVRIRYTRRMIVRPLLRTRALEDPVLSQMLIVRRPSGTNFPVTNEQFKRIEELIGAATSKWSKEEDLLALALYFDIKHGRVNEDSGSARLSRLLGRTDGAVTFRLVHFRHLDPDEKSDEAVDVSAQERAVWEEYAGREEDVRRLAGEMEAKLLGGGGLQSASDGSLKLVASVDEIRRAVRRFNQDAPSAEARARAILRQTTYWVFDGSSGTFGPGKFVGFVDLDFTRYEDAVDGKLSGARFDGNVTSHAIEKVVGVPYGKDVRLVEKLREWGTKLMGQNAFEGARGDARWKFLTLPQADRRYWKVAPGEKAHLWTEFRDGGLIAIGWGYVGDVSKLKSKEELSARMEKVFPDSKEGSVKTNANQIWSFAREIHVGDIIVANQGTSRIVGVGEVTGEYQYRADRKEYQHTLPVRWFDTSARDIPEQGAWLRTVLEIQKDRYKALFSGAKTGSENVARRSTSNIYDYLRDRDLHFPPELVTTYLLSLKTKPFVILSGISGTGKTKLAQVVAEWAGTEQRDVEADEPATTPTETDGTWLYQLQPYNFRHRKVIVAKEHEDLFELPNEGSQPISFAYEGAPFQGTLGAVTAKGRRLYELRFGVPLSARLAETLSPGDFVSFRVSVDGERQVVSLEKIAKERRTRTETIRRHEFVSVRADWLDGKEVLGFYNVLTEEYASRPFLNLLLRAHRDRGRPYFVILDEMNLARVEHYFADLLSATESRTIDDDRVLQEPVHLHDLAQCTPLDPPDAWQRPAACAGCRATDDEVEACALHFDGVQLVPPRLRVPTNVHVTGTVNVDETTHMFSPKVLDRANVIEFNQVDLAGYGEEVRSDYVIKNGALELGTTAVATQEDFHAIPKVTRDSLIALNALLADYHLHFGYRVANEIALYVRNAIDSVGPKAESAALDLQILQKVLPKLHGPKAKLAEPLRRLICFSVFGDGSLGGATEEACAKIEAAISADKPVAPPAGGDPVSAKMPKSAEKLARMLKTLRTQGFVSFIE